MNFAEAMKAFLDGKTVKLKDSVQGLNPKNNPDCYAISPAEMRSNDWEIVEPPKVKIKRWQWVRMDPRGVYGFYYTEEEAVFAFDTTNIKKLYWTEMEFEE